MEEATIEQAFGVEELLGCCKELPAEEFRVFQYELNKLGEKREHELHDRIAAINARNKKDAEILGVVYRPIVLPSKKGRGYRAKYKFKNTLWSGQGNIPKDAPSDVQAAWKAAKGNPIERKKILTDYLIDRLAPSSDITEEAVAH